MPVSYELIEAALKDIPTKNKKHFFDIGCGKGRAMCVAAIRYTVSVEDAAIAIIPVDVDCIFLFNPFDETIMKKVLENILHSLSKNPRPLNIIYSNPLCKNLFTSNGFSETLHIKKLTYFEISILSKK